MQEAEVNFFNIPVLQTSMYNWTKRRL